MPTSPDLAIFVLTTDNDRQQRQTKPITLPLAHARGVTTTTTRPITLSFAHARGVTNKPYDDTSTSCISTPFTYTNLFQGIEASLVGDAFAQANFMIL